MMENHGETLNGISQQPQRGLNNACNACGMTFDSTHSLQVHIHYHHTENSLNRWGQTTALSVTSNASNSTTDCENNNQPKHFNIQQRKTVSSPLNNTVSAAADSSDNQPSMPQPSAIDQSQLQNQFHHHQNQQLQQQSSEMHYASYMHSSYGQYYHQHSMEYGVPPPPTHFLGNPLAPPPPQSQLPQEYKSLPSTPRFHPYSHHLNSSTLAPAHHTYYHQSHVLSVESSSVASTQSAISPCVVTSSSPIQTNSMHSTTIPSSTANNINTCQLTPSPSPHQCNKCGLVCDTIVQLNEHHTTVHSTLSATETESNNIANNRNSGNDDIETEISSYQYSSYASGSVKEEPECDILDLDSQKMIYPPHDLNQQQQGPLPPMHSLHQIQRSMIWPQHGPPHDFLLIPQPSNQHHSQGNKSALYNLVKNEFSPQIVEQEIAGSNHHLTQMPSNQQTISPNVSKSYVNELSTNQIATSPSEFPSTTTPQDNGSQFQTYEAATSSLPNSAAVIKATSWKSNEPRRPKTYNCTACNKWFTSSGHLKRHYNTTLHKNAVKSSGQPDPATLPISLHHHPARDPNNKHHHRHNNKNINANKNVMAQQQHRQQQQSQQSPEIQSQYNTSSSLGFPQSQHPIDTGGFSQHTNQTQIQSNGMIPPNAQTGLSVLAFQPRGLLNYSNITGMHQSQEQHLTPLQQQQPHHQQSAQDFIQVAKPQVSPAFTIITNSMEATVQTFNIITPITINTNITQMYQNIPQPLEEEHQQTVHTIIGNESNDTIKNEYFDEVYQNYEDVNEYRETTKISPFSPDNPDKKVLAPYHKLYHDRSSTPQTGEVVPAHLSPNEPSSHQYSDMSQLSTTTIINEPGSPRVTSTSASASIGKAKTKQGAGTTKRRAKRDNNVSNITMNANETTVAGEEVTNKDPLRCEPCSKVFNKACYLTQHNKTFHSGEKPYKCQRCGKRFPCGQTHDKHLAKHIGNKPFKCNQCTKQFNHKTDLRRHMCLHTGTKPYSCNICNKGFIRKDHMVKHGLTHVKRKRNDIHADQCEQLTTNKHDDVLNSNKKQNKKDVKF